jgi:hypothetical protein
MQASCGPRRWRFSRSRRRARRSRAAWSQADEARLCWPSCDRPERPPRRRTAAWRPGTACSGSPRGDRPGRLRAWRSRTRAAAVFEDWNGRARHSRPYGRRGRLKAASSGEGRCSCAWAATEPTRRPTSFGPRFRGQAEPVRALRAGAWPPTPAYTHPAPPPAAPDAIRHHLLGACYRVVRGRVPYPDSEPTGQRKPARPNTAPADNNADSRRSATRSTSGLRLGGDSSCPANPSIPADPGRVGPLHRVPTRGFTMQRRGTVETAARRSQGTLRACVADP